MTPNLRKPLSGPKTDAEWQSRILDALEAFSPGAPIDEFSLLAGRTSQIDAMAETVLQRGQHAILYGERGVGKSSLANVFATKLIGPTRSLLAIHVNCHPNDDFSSLWRKVFRRLQAGEQNLSDRYQGTIVPDDVVLELSEFDLNTIPIVVLDEFDQLENLEARSMIANTIKNLSDRSVRTTVIIVGVADSVIELIADHKSTERCLNQIPMQRMTGDELKQVINRRLPDLGMTIKPDAMAYIVALSRGLPHYSHLFGQQSAKKALEDHKLAIELKHVESALPECVSKTKQSIREQYHSATMSPRKNHMYREVLLAAALSQVDDLGYFAPADLCAPLSALLKSPALVSFFGQHLKVLCEKDRGEILEQKGSPRKYRYRFVESMMQPFILMQGLQTGAISRQQVLDLAASHYEPRFSNEF
jgi:Cdc6-like AAA superfamily ATPase